ncbi:MAG: phosphoribosylformylglycinamidine synthase I [Candidatus Gracilibacteria bacterium]
MIKIAIIQFPGLNTEYETRREINRAGMVGEFFRWNDAPSKLQKYDGYVIGGGFSYEDRGRAGVIASLDPVMEELKNQAAKGKPLLGICNGAQILLETGLIPGVDGNKLVMALARNKRIKDGEVLGTGYFNVWSNLKCTAPKGSCMFTVNVNEGEILKAPIAHGEGRFTTEIQDLIPKLLENGQVAFRYCDEAGVMKSEFPINPNGAMYNIAAICNPAGNVMAIMPHLERASISSEKLFTSMRDSILALKKGEFKKRVPRLAVKPIVTWPLKNYESTASMQMFTDLIITDNEAQTYELTIQDLGFASTKVSRSTHYEIEYKGPAGFEPSVKKLIQSGILLNTNKEVAVTKFKKSLVKFKSGKFLPVEAKEDEQMTFRLLVREKQDFVGMSKTSKVLHRLKMTEFANIKTGTLWKITIPTKSQKVALDTLKKLVGTNIFFNPHSQDAWLV